MRRLARCQCEPLSHWATEPLISVLGFRQKFTSSPPSRPARPSVWLGQMIDNLLEIITWLDWYQDGEIRSICWPAGGDQRLVMYYDREALGDCDEISTLAGRPTCQISQSHARFNSSNNQMITIDIRITPKLITSS